MPYTSNHFAVQFDTREVTRFICPSCNGITGPEIAYVCRICYQNFCTIHYVEHTHRGPFCEDCGYNLETTDHANTCDNCGISLCNEHYLGGQHHCEEDLYDEEDEGRYTGRPAIIGYGREATLAYLDDAYEQDDKALGLRAAAVELEVEYMPRDGSSTDTLVLPDDVGIGSDGSLTNGIEVTTPPSKGKRLANIITESCDLLSQGGYGIQSSCGMHVHIDLRDKVNDTKFLSHLFNACFAFEDVLYAMQHNRRYNGQYSTPLRNSYKFFDMYGQASGDFDYKWYGYNKDWYSFETLRREKSHKYASVRYSAFNFHSVYYRGSLECRIHEGCLNANAALAWIDILQHIIARVDRSHSYAFMQKWAVEAVTRKKVEAFCRYFELPPNLRDVVISRITTGQGFGFGLIGDIQWGTAKRGRPTAAARPRRPRRTVSARNVGRAVICNHCGFTFALTAFTINCHGCDRSLFGIGGTPRYTLAQDRQAPALEWLFEDLVSSTTSSAELLSLNLR